MATRILMLGIVVAGGLCVLRWSIGQASGGGVGTHGLRSGPIMSSSPAEPDSIATEPRASASPTPSRHDGPPAPASLKPGQEVPDARLVDQNGREFSRSEPRGYPVVLTFVYTHCRVASMCPMATSKLVRVQEALAASGVAGVRFLVVSFDSQRDRPAQLREFAAAHGADVSSFTFARAEPATVARLSWALNTYYREQSPGVFEHNIVVSLLDDRGILRDDFFGTSWDVPEMVEAVRALDPPALAVSDRSGGGS